jgi:ParB-like chromosome segregation protein Spo0J
VGHRRCEAVRRNTKVHSKEHVEKLKKSISEQGLFDALIVDMDGVLIAGHGRFQALVELGQVKVPVQARRT